MNETNNLALILGPNNSGKTVYLKQVALLQVMAQMGCFVPATSAELRIVDRIFSRMGFNDDIETNCSTFAREVIETFLDNACRLTF